MSKMTVSNGLRLVADLKGKIKKRLEHAQESVTYFEDDPPAFLYADEMGEVERLRAEMIRVQTAYAVSNATTKVEWNGKPVLVAWAIRHMEEIRGQLKWLEGLEGSLLPRDEAIVESVQGVYDKDHNYSHVSVSKKKRCMLAKGKHFNLMQELQDEHNRLNAIVEASNNRVELPSIA